MFSPDVFVIEEPMETYLSHLSVHEFKRGRDGIFAFVHTLDYRKPGQKLTEQKFTWNSKGWLWNGRLRGKKNTLNWCFVVLFFCSVFFAFHPVNMQFVYLSNIHTWMVHCLLWVSAVSCGSLQANCGCMHSGCEWIGTDLFRKQQPQRRVEKNGDYIKGT